MEITDIRIRKVESEGKLKAYVTVTFDGCFVVHNVKVIEGRSGVFIAMPSRRTKNGEYKDVAHPINSGFRAELQDRVLKAYDQENELLRRNEPATRDEPVRPDEPVDRQEQVESDPKPPEEQPESQEAPQ